MAYVVSPEIDGGRVVLVKEPDEWRIICFKRMPVGYRKAEFWWRRETPLTVWAATADYTEHVPRRWQGEAPLHAHEFVVIFGSLEEYIRQGKDFREIVGRWLEAMAEP